MPKTILITFIGILLFLIIVFLLGPRPYYKTVNNRPSTQKYDIETLDTTLAAREKVVQFLKSNNEARIIWRDSIHQQTEYSIVYLHGFTASQAEGDPTHIHVAKNIDANLYLPRMSGHGIDSKDAMVDLTPERMVEDAKDAVAIGKTIGKKVIVMGCSTGATLGIYLAAGDPHITTLLLLSPNIDIRNRGIKLMTGPWGRTLAYTILGSYVGEDESTPHDPYWTDVYSTNGLIALQALLDQTMKDEIFEKITCPLYCGYYYKDENHQDPVISIASILKFRDEISTPSQEYKFEAFPQAGSHVISSQYKTDHWPDVVEAITKFLSERGID